MFGLENKYFFVKNVHTRPKISTHAHAKICKRTQKYVHARKNIYAHAKKNTRTQKYARTRKKLTCTKNKYAEKLDLRKN